MPAEVINSRYEVIEALPTTETDSSRLYKARDTAEGRVVALKVISRSALDASGNAAAQFLAALEAVKGLDHTNILRVYEFGELEATDDLYVASEYLRGITLTERIRRVAPFSLPIAADIAVAIAEALKYAHQHNVAHGDLGPGSVTLSAEGQIKVANFLGFLPEHGAASPGTDWESGFSGTAMSDLYALGGIIYQMLTGSAPKATDGALVSPRALNPSVPPALEGIIQKAMHPDSTRRYQTAVTMLSDLRIVCESLHTGRPLTKSPLTEKRVPRAAGHQSAPQAAAGSAFATPAAQPGVLTAAADDLEDERYTYEEERQQSKALGIAVRILLVVVILAVVFFTWKLTRFLAIPTDVTVPNLIGKTFDEAQRIANLDHFQLTVGGSDYSTKWPENQIYQQDPMPGRAIKAENQVTIYRSLGTRVAGVPDLVGMTQERAMRTLQESDFPAGTITEQYSESAEKGVVVSQQPEKGTQVARHTPVNFFVSKGKQPPDVPSQVEAAAIAPDKVNITWNRSVHADTYTVSRSNGAENKVIALGEKNTQVTDTGLTPDTTYTYTVSAVNAVGESDQSVAVQVTTPPRLASPPVIAPDVKVTPPATDPGLATPSPTSPNSDPPQDNTPARMRDFTIRFKVPRRLSGTHHVQLEVQDATGTTLVYDETREAGDSISTHITAFGNKVIFRVFMDSKLIKQETK